MGFEHEIELVRVAHELDLLTTPYIFSAEDAAAMAAAGADIVVAYPGLTVGGGIGADTARTLDECVDLINEWAAAAGSVRGASASSSAVTRSPNPGRRSSRLAPRKISESGQEPSGWVCSGALIAGERRVRPGL